MALTIDKLKADNTIKGANLPDSVLAAIATLSTNDEKIEIDKAVGINYGMVDAVVAEIVGESNTPGNKTTEYIKKHLKALKEKADSAGNVGAITTERDNLKKEVDKLKKEMVDGSTDATLKKQISDLEAKIRQKDSDIENLRTSKEGEISTLKKSLDGELSTNLSLALKSQAEAYFNTLKFDPKLPQWAIDAKKEQVINEVMAKKGQAAFDGEGVDRKLVFKDSQGNVLKNAANGLNPFTFGDLAGEFVKDAIIDAKGGGGGTKPPTGGGGGGTKPTGGGGGGLDISSARTQGDVIGLIREQIKSEGIPVTKVEEYQTRYDELWATEGVADLPMK